VLALSSITAYHVTQQRADCLALYLSTYGQHIYSIEVTAMQISWGPFQGFSYLLISSWTF
jgi:hypothetical protein